MSNSNDDNDRENYCEQHDVDIAALPAGYNRCPYCEMDADREAQIRHQMTRDPTREPW